MNSLQTILMQGEHQLGLTCHDLAKMVNDSGQVDMLVLDFAKAFDIVAHKRLLGKSMYPVSYPT